MFKSWVVVGSGSNETESMQFAVSVVKTENGIHLSTLGLFILETKIKNRQSDLMSRCKLIDGLDIISDTTYLSHSVKVVVAHGKEAVVLVPSRTGGFISFWSGLGHFQNGIWARTILDPETRTSSIRC